MRRGLSIACSVSILTFSLALPADRHKVVAPPGTGMGLPFSPAIEADGFLYLSGALGNTPGTREVEGDIRVQTRQTLKNLEVVLKAAGMGFADVVSANVFLSDTRLFQPFNEVYREYFRENPPARATVEGAIVFPKAVVEIALVAARPERGKTIVTPNGWKRPGSPSSWGVLAGDTLFVSGIISSDPVTGNSKAGDVAAQTRTVLENVGAILREAGMDYGDVVSSKVFLADSRDFSEMNGVYRSFFPKDPPARATSQTRLMHQDWKVEIQCVAVRGGSREVVAPAGEPLPASPYSPGIRAGGRLYLAGMVGRGKTGWADGIEAQTRQTLENLRAVLTRTGLEFGHVVEANVYLSDIRYYGQMNQVYKTVFPGAPPARATFGSVLMSPDALVEIMMTAHEAP